MPGRLLTPHLRTELGPRYVAGQEAALLPALPGSKPVPLLIQRREEETVPYQRLQHVLTIVSSSRGVT